MMRLAQWLLIGTGIVMAWVFPSVVMLPWGLLWVCSRMALGRRIAFAVVLGVSGLYLILGVWAYWDTIYLHPDPQGGLIFMVMPVLGGLVALALMSGLWLSQPHPNKAR